jgi:hypothetical protein
MQCQHIICYSKYDTSFVCCQKDAGHKERHVSAGGLSWESGDPREEFAAELQRIFSAPTKAAAALALVMLFAGHGIL